METNWLDAVPQFPQQFMLTWPWFNTLWSIQDQGCFPVLRSTKHRTVCVKIEPFFFVKLGPDNTCVIESNPSLFWITPILWDSFLGWGCLVAKIIVIIHFVWTERQRPQYAETKESKLLCTSLCIRLWLYTFVVCIN